jgi:cyclic-di-GMP-binding protein
MNRPDLVAASRPLLRDVKSCDEWLARAALADSHHACSSFVQLLDELEDAPPAVGACLQILERLRQPMLTSLEQQERRFGSRPLPLGPTENTAFLQACDLWLAALRAWRNLLRHAKAGPHELSEAKPLIALRVLEFSAGLIGSHYAARREVDETVWHWVHQSFAFAESLRLSEAEVAEGERSSCSAIYAELLLVALAHPYGLSQRELIWTWRWARRWAPKVKLWRAAEKGGGYAVDLDGCLPPTWMRAGEPGASLRYIECSEVALSIRKRMKKLIEGADPASLGLGRDCTRQPALELLTSLLRCWTDAPLVRQFPRRPAASPAGLVSGFIDIYRSVSGQAFETGAKNWEYSRRSAEQIHIFQRALDMENRGTEPLATETWEALDESANGFRIQRRGAGMRLVHKQLVALRPEDARQAMLCEVRWLYESRGHVINAGVKALPGLPQPCSVRVAGTSAEPMPWSPAFMLPGLGASPDSVVLPSGWYQASRLLEVRLGETIKEVNLNALLERGHDFDRASFS